MSDSHLDFLKTKMDAANYAKLAVIRNTKFLALLADAVQLCEPANIFICSDAPDDVRYIREQSVAQGEEIPLALPGHTYHFDGPQDQGRDRDVTKYLVPVDDVLNKALNQIEREAGLAEVRGLLAGSMRGRQMIVRFLSLGPSGSIFSIPCAQCTDSFYVGHSEDLLYRRAYEQFVRMGDEPNFFWVVHSAGKLDERKVSAEPDKKRIYIDYTRETVYSVNTQYAGNTVGLKKLALRLTIRKADREGWLAEHMFLMAVKGPGGRKTYFGGAFPSACGKTATAMLPGEQILGDDIAYFRNIDGEARAVNAEAGIFGIIQNANPTDDPAIYRALTTPGEVIFSNVLVKDGKPYWLGMTEPVPDSGVNFSGEWYKGKKAADGSPIPLAHKNARYTVALSALENSDTELDNPLGVPLAGIMYGGRDYKGYVPVQQSFDWSHGIIAYGASLETETTYAIVGMEGVPEINMMSIQDFVAIPLGKYVQNNLEFGARLKRPPVVFGVNYFLKDRDADEFLNAVRDKAVWVKWMELRVHGDVGAIMTPTGWIPKYADLAPLFRQVLHKDYVEADYARQFTIRVPENLAKLERAEKFHRAELPDAPAVLWDVLEAQRRRLLEARERFGDYITPDKFAARELWQV